MLVHLARTAVRTAGVHWKSGKAGASACASWETSDRSAHGRKQIQGCSI